MTTRLRSYWERIRTNYWFIPALMSLGAIGLSVFSLQADTLYFDAKSITWLWRGGSEGAQQVLSTIASSMITVAGVVFSITLVVFTMASGQFGPRVLRNFMRDLGTQIVLGTFLSTFLYCLLVLRSVHEVSEAAFVPRFSMSCALVLSVASLAVLIYFIHHVCDSVQAENLVAHVGRELESAIKETFPVQKGTTAPDGNREADETEFPEQLREACWEVRASRSGYLQALELETLMDLATANDLKLRLLQHPGNFVAECNPLVQAIPRENCSASVGQRLENAFILGRHRTPTQDIDYSVHQLVEIAVRALSPAINDPYTAIACIDWLGAAMNIMAGREAPSQYHRDAGGVVRLTLHTQTFAGMMDRAFNQIRQYGAKSPAVLIRLLETFARIAGNLRRARDWEALRRHAQCVTADARETTIDAVDFEAIEARYRHFLEVCDARMGPVTSNASDESRPDH
jgi:uncharacterized membrane protein